MDADINDIWDLPVETSINRESSPNSSTRPLFLPSDDEEGTATTTKQSSANKTNPDVDALFEGLDDIDDSFHELAPALDLDALRREADARNTRAVRAEFNASIPAIELSDAAAGKKSKGGKSGPLDGMDGNEDGKEKKRKPLPKLDEARLLGQNGFPQLVKDTKNFKPKGKGHEATDLDRVLQLYQFWTHKLYPKTRFKETVDRVEKLCHSKRMQVSLGVWRDEAKGLVNGVRLSTATGNDSDSDAPGSPRGDATSADRCATPSNQPFGNLEEDSDGPPISSDAEHPPPSSPDRDEAAAAELDALLEEEEAAQRASGHTRLTGHAWKKLQTSNSDAVMDEDVDLWDALGTDAPPTSDSTMAPPRPPLTDEDEEMWDIVREFEQEQEKNTARESNPASSTPTTEDTQADDLDDLYL